MSGASCKAALCAWREVDTLPPGHGLETALRHLTVTAAYTEAFAELEKHSPSDFSRAIKILSMDQMGPGEQQWLRNLYRKLADL